MKMRVLMISGVILAIVIFIVAAFVLKLFVIGDTQDVNSLTIHNLSASSEKLFFNFRIPLSSANVVRSYKYRISDDILYIELTSVIVGIFRPLHTVEIEGDFSAINKVMLEDNENKRLIWEKRYYDINKDIFSELFETPITAAFGNVVYMDASSGTHKLVVRDIFDDSVFYKDFELDFYPSANPADALRHAEFLDENTLMIEYLSALDDVVEQTATLDLS